MQTDPLDPAEELMAVPIGNNAGADQLTNAELAAAQVFGDLDDIAGANVSGHDRATGFHRLNLMYGAVDHPPLPSQGQLVDGQQHAPVAQEVVPHAILEEGEIGDDRIPKGVSQDRRVVWADEGGSDLDELRAAAALQVRGCLFVQELTALGEGQRGVGKMAVLVFSP